MKAQALNYVQKLQGKKALDDAPAAERMLGQCWQQAQKTALTHEKACRVFGRCCLCTVSFLLRYARCPACSARVPEAVPPENLAEVQNASDREVAGKATKTLQAGSSGQSAKDILGKGFHKIELSVLKPNPCSTPQSPNPYASP